MANLFNFLKTYSSQLPMQQLMGLLTDSQNLCLFVKNRESSYCYANPNYVHLMGLTNLQQLIGLKDTNLYENKREAYKYVDYDRYVLEESKSLAVKETISPYYIQPVSKTMKGYIHPLYGEGDSPQYVLGVVSPETKLLKLDFATIFSLNKLQLDEVLIRRSYKIIASFGTISLSRMEIHIILQLLKGLHAGQIAKVLQIKQSTVESYLVNIKNKMVASSKSELLNRIIDEKILEQVIV